MPPKKGSRREKPVFVKPPEFSSDDEPEIPEIEEEEDVEHRGEKHQEYSSQPDGSDEKNQDLQKRKGDSSDTKAGSSTSKTIIHAQKLADKAHIKSQLPWLRYPTLWIAILGVVQIITIITGVCVCVSLENRIKDLKSCQKGDTAVDSSQSCADCMCIATEGFSSKEFSNIVQNQRKTEEKYMLLENSVKDLQGKLSENDDKLFGFENKVLDIEKEMSELNKKITQINSNPIIVDEDFRAMFEEEWRKRKETLMTDFDSREKSLNDILDKELKEIKANVSKKLVQFQSKTDQQWQENIQSIEEHVKTFKNGILQLTQDVESIKKKMTSFDNKFEGVNGQLNFFFQEIYGHNNYFLGLFFVVVIGVIIITCKYLTPRHARHPDETSVKLVGQKANLLSLSIDDISKKLKRKELKNGTLIISFHPSTQQFHQSVLDAVSTSIKSTALKAVIHSFDNLMNVEPQKLVIIFVDFNDRNIILENEETEIGDLRNQTTKVFLSLGCDVFVVYCKDKGSKDLKQDNLYNASLTSIDRHPVLSELKNKNRVLSINDRFHPHQVEHLKNSFQQW